MKLYYFQFVFCLKNFQKIVSFLTLLFFTCNAFSIEIFDVEKNSMVVGNIKIIKVDESETVADIANRYNTGFQDLWDVPVEITSVRQLWVSGPV